MWEAGEEPRVMGAKTRSEAPASRTSHPSIPRAAYSAECLEGKVSEVRRHGVLRSSQRSLNPTPRVTYG
jgi:hypothetical protein